MLAQVKASLRPFRLYRAARFGWHFATNPVFRQDHWLLWRGMDNLFQHRSITMPDRYPETFKFVRDHIGDRSEPRLLSFGCATGEEVFSLHSHLPRATIKGIDINAANIAACLEHKRGLGGDPTLVFTQGSSADGEPACFYDAVFCMAVFVRWQLRDDRTITSCAPHLRFEDYARTVAGLAACVRPGGLFVLRHSIFRFSDTESARDFRLLLSLPEPAEFFPRFGPDNRRLPDEAREAVVFQKISGPYNACATPLR